MELWDIYDCERKPTGRTHIRGVPMDIHDYHIVTDIWTVTPHGEILLTQRHPDKAYGLMWECTGGSVQAGEDSMQGALRELYEEVGIKARPEELKLIHTICLKERFVDTYITRQNITVEQLHLQKEEVVGAKLVTMDRLMKLWEQGIVMPKSRFLLYKDLIEEFMGQPVSG